MKSNRFSCLRFSEKGVHFNRKYSKQTFLEIINYKLGSCTIITVHREGEREIETDRLTERERQRERERQQADRHVNQNVIPHQRAEPQKEILHLRRYGALRQSLATLTSVLFRGQVIKCTGERRYDSSCIQPYIIFGAGIRKVPEQNMCKPLRYWVLGLTVGRLRKQQAKGKLARLKCCFYINSDFAINCSQSI